MKTDRIYILPIIILAILLIGLVGLYYYAAGNVSASSYGQETATTTTAVYNDSPTSNQATYTSGSFLSGDSRGTNMAEISNQGVLPERLGWQTFTNIDYSYALSYPPGWQLLRGSSFASVTDGSASVSVQAFNLTPNTSPSLFAAENGAYGLVSTSVNAYNAIEAFQGSNTLYFIVNGSVGYKITVSSSTNENDAAVIRSMILAFTVTKAR